MSPLLQLLLLLSGLILLAKLSGWLSSRLGQPAVLGELLIGLLLGPSLLDILHLPLFSGLTTGETLSQLAELGVILLMLIAGLEVDLRDLRRAGRSSLFGGGLGVVLGLAGVWGFSLLMGYDSAAALAIGVLVTATSVSISAQTLLELGVLGSQEGIALLGAGIVDDVLIILILSLQVAFRGGNSSLVGILWIVGRMVLFLGVGGVLCLWGLPRLMNRVERWPVSAALPAAVLVVTLFTAWAADYLGGLATITGAFLVGLGLRRSAVHNTIVEAMHTLGYTLFVPLFFVGVGLQANVRTLDASLLLFAGLLIVVSILVKSVGNGLGAWLGGLPPEPALRMGLGMMPRGEVSLIAATVMMQGGWIGGEFFAVVVLFVLVTAVLTPILLKLAFRRQQAQAAGQRPA
jgi:Kef-type K+ transport system membrane component KefB